MKLTFNLILAASAVSLATMANAALYPSSGTVTMENTSFDGGTGSYNIGGGEFQATIAGGYAPFYTFCTEIGEEIEFGVPLQYTTSYLADSQGDHISKGTAYLYEMFVKGKLYDRTLDDVHDEMAGYLQAAIWVLADEDFSSKSALAKAKFFNVATNPFIGKVVGLFGSLAGAKADDDKGRVKVMNLTLNGEEKQDVLVYVPDSGATIALLGLALSGLALAGRCRRSGRN